MNVTTKTGYTDRPSNQRPDPLLSELRALRAELRASREEQGALRRMFDEFAEVFLNAKFPYGKPTDRWARR